MTEVVEENFNGLRQNLSSLPSEHYLIVIWRPAKRTKFLYLFRVLRSYVIKFPRINRGERNMPQTNQAATPYNTSASSLPELWTMAEVAKTVEVNLLGRTYRVACEEGEREGCEVESRSS